MRWHGANQRANGSDQDKGRGLLSMASSSQIRPRRVPKTIVTVSQTRKGRKWFKRVIFMIFLPVVISRIARHDPFPTWACDWKDRWRWCLLPLCSRTHFNVELDARFGLKYHLSWQTLCFEIVILYPQPYIYNVRVKLLRKRFKSIWHYICQRMDFAVISSSWATTASLINQN